MDGSPYAGRSWLTVQGSVIFWLLAYFMLGATCNVAAARDTDEG